jgi:hypothetical protein
MKADEKIVDAAKGFERLKRAARNFATVPKREIDRRAAQWAKDRK